MTLKDFLTVLEGDDKVEGLTYVSALKRPVNFVSALPPYWVVSANHPTAPQKSKFFETEEDFEKFLDEKAKGIVARGERFALIEEK